MRKFISILFTLMLISIFIFQFTSCSNLKPSNLKANYHLKKANKYYSEEKYRKAIEEYEEALKFNPDLKVAYLYLGTSNAMMYKPGRDNEKNKMYAEKAKEYLLKAKEIDPENDKIDLALGDLFDKMGDFENAEKHYLAILEKNPDNPKTYYILANFYSKYGKDRLAISMYQKRIDLEPENPEGYLYLANFYQDRRMWDEAIANHYKRIFVMTDKTILDIQNEIEKLKADIEKVNKIKKVMEPVLKNKAITDIDGVPREEWITKKKEELKNLGSVKEIEAKIEEKKKELDVKIAENEKKMLDLDKETKKKLAVAYYTLGVVFWNKSYQTRPEFMGPKERDLVINKGLHVLEMSSKLDSTYPEPWAYISLLYREKLKVDKKNRDKYIAKAKKLIEKFNELRKRKLQSEQFVKELEKMDK